MLRRGVGSTPPSTDDVDSMPGAPGFTMLEVLVALVILMVTVLGVATSAGRLSTMAATTEARALALQSVEDRLSMIRLDPRYVLLDSLYAGQEDDLVGLEDFTRTTAVTRIVLPQAGGRSIDYQNISVTVDGPGLPNPLTRTLTLGAP